VFVLRVNAAVCRGAGCRGFVRRGLRDGLSMGAEGAAHKKGGVDGLGKLRSGAKRNGVILSFLICGGSELKQNEITNIHRLLMAVPVCGGGGECFPSPMSAAHTAVWRFCVDVGLCLYRWRYA
jgi:hypothetical protein